MRSRMRLVTLAVATALVAGWANAQTKHEFGVDVQLANAKPDGGDGVTSLGTPVDVRIGFAGSSALMWETRFSLLYSKPKDGSLFLFQPDLNALWHIGGATPIKGAYLTAGVGINYLSVDPGTPGSSSESSTRIGFNGGIGTRIPWGSAAWRLEGFVADVMKKGSKGDSDYEPSVMTIGVRFGVSLWH